MINNNNNLTRFLVAISVSLFDTEEKQIIEYFFLSFIAGIIYFVDEY
jgi:hypothetical protein